MIRRLLLLLSLATAALPAEAAPSRSDVIRLVSGDDCRAIPGYREFRAALKHAADGRDVTALQQLFHPRGSMRVHGVYMTATRADADEARFAPVWDEIGDILQRGCARNGTRLILPGIARMAEDNVATETLVVIRPTWLRKKPTEGSRSARLSTGRMLTEIMHGDRWTRVQLGRLEGYVPTADVRNPYDTRIEAELSEGRWTIIEFGSGI